MTAPPRALGDLIASLGEPDPAPAAAVFMPSPAPSAAPRRRIKLWELEDKYHCPVIGTCLTLAEIGKVARRSGFAGAGFDEYRLHVEAVSVSCSRNDACEAMQRLLEHKFAADVARFEAAGSDAEVLALWRRALERGEIAGPMWAAMTHRACGAQTRHQVYADVHMLSHQVGAGQAADLRRLQWLEGAHAQVERELGASRKRLQAQEAQWQRQDAELRRSLAAAEEELRQLAPLRERLRSLESGAGVAALERRLADAEALAERALARAARADAMEAHVAALRGENERLARERDQALAERDALERLWAAAPATPPDCDGGCASCSVRLQGRCVLCVGGRTPLLPQYRQLAERLGVRLLHHDGGREETLSRLPELLDAADAVICPTDCVGHMAYYNVKRHCKLLNKPCVLVKSSGVASFAAALTRLAAGRAEIAGG
jgi:hypothetical protein